MLEAVGLTAHEESVYLHLVRHGRATVDDLAAHCQTSAREMDRVVESLGRRGLAHRTPGPHGTVVPVPPELGIDALVRLRQEDLEQVRHAAARLAAEYRADGRPSEELIELVQGRGGVLQAFERVQHAARTEVLVFVAPPFATDDRVNPTQFERESAGITYRAVYGPDALEEPGFLTGLATHLRAGERARLAGTVPIKMALADRALGLLPLAWTGAAQDSAVLVHPCGLLDALVALFESVWASATPLLLGPGGRPEPEDISATDRALLSLLAIGLTDEAAGARLNMSRRTVVRRVQQLMAMTDSRSRLQLGWRARERGWL